MESREEEGAGNQSTRDFSLYSSMSQRPTKRTRLNNTHVRVEDAFDLEWVNARDAKQTTRGATKESTRSPQKGRTTWDAPQTWVDSNMPEDFETGLEDGGWASDWEGDGARDQDQGRKVGGSKARSIAAVRAVFSSTQLFIYVCTQSRPHLSWRNNHRQDYADRVSRHEGRGEFRNVVSCPDCPAREGSPLYRCQDCFLEELVCQTCSIRRHHRHPLHRLQVCTLTSHLFPDAHSLA